MAQLTLTIADQDVPRIRAALAANGFGTVGNAIHQYLFTLVQAYEQEQAIADAQATINNPPDSQPISMQVT